jgi:hypothetical protein
MNLALKLASIFTSQYNYLNNGIMKLSSTLGGLAGAAALTLVNEGVRKVNADAPRLDLLGQNAVAKFFKGNDMLSKATQQFFPLAGDLVSNTLFYGLARGNNSKDTYLRGAVLGLAAGVGAVALPNKMGLDNSTTARTSQTKAMTIAWYVIGGLVAAAVINLLDKYDQQDVDELKRTVSSTGKSMATSVVKKIASTI